MTRIELIDQIKRKKSFLCVGLDSDINKIPFHLLESEDPIFEFNRAIIGATKEYAVAYKPNIAFYESRGAKGMESLRKTLEIIPKECFTIADAKRGDIGNTASMYAKAFFDKSSSGFDFDSITVAPYMGIDSITPFLEFQNKWAIVLGLTSNPGSNDFQQNELRNSKRLFEEVVSRVITWGTDSNLMFVVGATRGKDIAAVRKQAPNHFFLVPGVGSQGGSLEEVVEFGMNNDCGLLVNSSRGIIYASKGYNFASIAGKEAQKIQLQMQEHLEHHKII